MTGNPSVREELPTNRERSAGPVSDSSHEPYFHQSRIELTGRANSRPLNQSHFSSIHKFLNRAQSAHGIGGSGAGRGKRRCEQRHNHHNQDAQYVDDRVGCADAEQEGADQSRDG